MHGDVLYSKTAKTKGIFRVYIAFYYFIPSLDLYTFFFLFILFSVCCLLLVFLHFARVLCVLSNHRARATELNFELDVCCTSTRCLMLLIHTLVLPIMWYNFLHSYMGITSMYSTHKLTFALLVSLNDCIIITCERCGKCAASYGLVHICDAHKALHACMIVSKSKSKSFPSGTHARTLAFGRCKHSPLNNLRPKQPQRRNASTYIFTAVVRIP